MLRKGILKQANDKNAIKKNVKWSESLFAQIKYYDPTECLLEEDILENKMDVIEKVSNDEELSWANLMIGAASVGFFHASNRSLFFVNVISIGSVLSIAILNSLSSHFELGKDDEQVQTNEDEEEVVTKKLGG